MERLGRRRRDTEKIRREWRCTEEIEKEEIWRGKGDKGNVWRGKGERGDVWKDMRDKGIDRRKMRYKHYKHVVKWDRLQQFPYRTNGDEVPKVEQLTRVWSLVGLGFQVKHVPAAWTALELITGQKPIIVSSKKSVAQRRLKEGDAVGCIVTVTGKDAYNRREQWSVRVFPEIRPFDGYKIRQPHETNGRRTKGVVDERGQLTYHMEQPGVIPSRMSYYESYFQLVLGSSGNDVGGRYRSVKTTAKTKEEGVALIEGRRFPIRIAT